MEEEKGKKLTQRVLFKRSSIRFLLHLLARSFFIFSVMCVAKMVMPAGIAASVRLMRMLHVSQRNNGYQLVEKGDQNRSSSLRQLTAVTDCGIIMLAEEDYKFVLITYDHIQTLMFIHNCQSSALFIAIYLMIMITIARDRFFFIFQNLELMIIDKFSLNF